MVTTSESISVTGVPQRIDFYGMIHDLQVRSMADPKKGFMATYFYGADPVWIKYGSTAQEAADNLWNFVKSNYRVKEI